jgi:hypothetical protein
MNDKEILQQLGLETADPALQDRALQNFYNIVEKRVMGLLQEMMTDEQRKEFEAKSDTLSREEGVKWLSDNVSNVEELYDNVARDYIDEVTKQ